MAKQETFDFAAKATEPWPEHCLSPIDEVVLSAQELPDNSFRSMREWQIDREIANAGLTC